MDRRNFLARLLAGATGVAIASTVDVDRLLWVPGEKTIFIPETVLVPCDWSMGWLTREALKILERNLQFFGHVNREYSERGPRRIGDTVRLRLPQSYPAAGKKKSILDPTCTVTMDHLVTADIDLGDLRTCRSPIELRSHLEPIVADMAAAVKRAGMNVMADLQIPRGVEEGHVVRSPKSGLSVRGLSGFDVTEGRMRGRLDVLGGRC